MHAAAISPSVTHPVIVVSDWLPIPRWLSFLVELRSRHIVLHLLVAVVGIIVALQWLILWSVSVLIALQLLLLLAVVIHLFLAWFVLCV